MLANSPYNYATAAFGKWHLTTDTQAAKSPVDHGFDHWVGNYFSFDQVGEHYDSWTRYEVQALTRLRPEVTDLLSRPPPTYPTCP
jgi:arylsulfatase A-like enzyme